MKTFIKHWCSNNNKYNIKSILKCCMWSHNSLNLVAATVGVFTHTNVTIFYIFNPAPIQCIRKSWLWLVSNLKTSGQTQSCMLTNLVKSTPRRHFNLPAVVQTVKARDTTNRWQRTSSDESRRAVACQRILILAMARLLSSGSICLFEHIKPTRGTQ